MGDAADGIPGIAKWGAKSTATVLAHYKKIENIPEDGLAWNVKVRGARGLSDSLNKNREDAMLFRKLAVLRQDVPLESSVKDWHWGGADKVKLNKLAKDLNEPAFASLRT